MAQRKGIGLPVVGRSTFVNFGNQSNKFRFGRRLSLDIVLEDSWLPRDIFKKGVLKVKYSRILCSHVTQLFIGSWGLGFN